MSNTTSSQPLAFLVTHGRSLSKLLQRAQHKNNAPNGMESIHEEVKDIIVSSLDEIKKGQGRAFFPKESVTKYLQRLKLILEDFSKYDPGNRSQYENLTKRVEEFNLPPQFPAAPLSSSSGDCLKCDAPPFDYLRDELAATFSNLSDDEKKCLFCTSLMSSTGRRVKKRELIHWWIGMDLIENQLEGDDVLAKLASMGFIERTFGDRKFFNRYKLNDGVRDMVRQEMNAFGHIEEERCWSVMYSHKQQEQPPSLQRRQQQHSLQRLQSGQSQQPLQQQHESPRIKFVREVSRLRSFGRLPTFKSPQDDKSVPVALLNIGEDTLNAETFERIFKMKNLKVIQLGNWHQDLTNYILVKNVEQFKDLKHLGKVRFLSLHGISGITKLPDSIYKLDNLMVLDLRACHNLESLPDGIESLTKLTHLDLSECYLLRQLPVGIRFLSELRVLKGFIVNPDLNMAATNQQGLFCAFSDLSELPKLGKLTVRTRRMNFPTDEDMNNFCHIKQLTNLQIAWAGNPSDAEIDGSLQKFPTKLKKLVLEAAPESTASLLLGIISNQKDNCLEKLYIRGGGLCELEQKYCFPLVKVLYLRYLPKLHCSWDEFRKAFPNVIQLEIFRCPNLIFFPCDENGLWELNA